MSTDDNNEINGPLLPIAKMDRETVMKLNAQAVKNQREVVLNNGLVLNQNNSGKMGVDLKVMVAFEEQSKASIR